MALLTSSWLVDTILFFVSSVVFTYYYLTARFGYWKRKNVPSVEPIPLFGNFLPVILAQQAVGDLFDDCYNRVSGPFVGIHIFRKPYLIVRDPDLVKAVLVKDFNYFTERSFADGNKQDPLGTNNLFTIKNPHWKVMRSKLTPIFTSGRMKQMFPLMTDVGQRLSSHVRDLIGHENSDPTEIKETCAKYTTDVIASCAFGIEANSFTDRNAEFRSIGRKIFDFTYRRGIELTSFFFLPTLVNLFGFMFFEPSCSVFLRNVFWKTIRSREATGIKRPDLIETLIRLKNEDAQNTDKSSGVLKLEGDTLVAQAAVFFTAGFETSASTMAFTLYHLALNPPMQQKVRSEILAVLAAHNDELTYESINDMKYLNMCVKETLRLYPPLPFLNRECDRNYTFPGTDLTIEKGTPIIIALSALQRDPDYFPEPEKFIPERFSDANKPNLRPFSYLPFGEGPHNCIGERFGVLQTKIGLIHILKECEVVRAKTTPVPMRLDPKALILAPTNGIPMHVRKAIAAA